jgi:sugar (pentulose or hexulose) kinase
MKECLVGIDSCGTNIKVGAFSKSGNRLFLSKRRNIPIITDEGYFYFDWKYQKKMIFEMLKEIIDGDYKILSIGTSSCGESVYPLDSDGNVIDNAIAWYCRRTEEQAQEFVNKISEREVYEICFLKPFYSYTAHKINWYKKYKPNIFKKTACWLHVNNFVNYLLTGKKYIDYNQAGSTSLFDIRRNDWSNKLFQINEISKDTFPPLIKNGSFVGFVNSKNKKLLGINYDIPVSVGGHDAWCGLFALGIGVSEKSKEFLPSFTGTAGIPSIGEIISRKELEKTDTNYFYKYFSWVIPHVYPGTYHCLGVVMDYYGALIEYFIRLLYNKKADEITRDDYYKLEKEVESSIPGSNGVRIYVEENEVKKTRNLNGINILGCKILNTRGDVMRAVMEYLCIEDKKYIKEIERRTKVKKKILVIGGLANNKSFIKIRANILNRDQYICKEEELNLLGAALLGGVGAKIFNNHIDAVESVGILYKDIVKPDSKIVREYRRIYNFD